MRLAGNHPRGGLLISLAKTLVTADATRRRAIGQILLLAAGFLVLVAISVTSVVLVNQAREDNGWVVHTVEVENQINTVLLEIRRAESAARGYLLTAESQFLADHETAVASIIPDVDKLAKLTTDNPVQIELSNKVRSAVSERLAEFAKAIDFVKRNDAAGGVAMLRDPGAGASVRAISEASSAMFAEENRLFAQRTEKADRTQVLASSVTIAGSACVIALAALSIFLVRRSARARDEAEAQLRDSNVNLEIDR